MTLITEMTNNIIQGEFKIDELSRKRGVLVIIFVTLKDISIN